MKKPIILGAMFLGAVGWIVSSCSGTKTTNNQGSAGGSTSVGGSGSHLDSGTSEDSGSGMPAYCSENTGGILYDADGGVTRYGASDPEDSLAIGVGGYYAMAGTNYHGYCFTYSDSTDGTVGGTSTLTPPCGKTGPCYTVASGLCSTAQIDQVDKAHPSVSWGGGIGCSLKQAQDSTFVDYASLSGKTSMTISVTGCKVPAQLQLQLNVANPPLNDAGQYGDGYYCKLVTLSAPDSNGTRTGTVQLKNMMQDCWASGPLLDPETMIVTSMQAQINALDTGASKWDFCVSKWTID